MPDFDLFLVFRTVLFIGLTVYFGLTTIITIRTLYGILAGEDPRRRLLRACISYQLVTTRVKPLAGELAQIGFWIGVLVLIWYAHQVAA
jgi:hypothetical protein